MNDTADSNIQQSWKRILGSEVGFWHLANRQVYWVGVTLFLLQQWLMLWRLNCLQLFLILQIALQAGSSAMTGFNMFGLPDP